MVRILFIISIISITIDMSTAQSIAGDYNLVGIQDAAGGFRFTKEGRFEFFFIYGVVDRIATGTYTLDGNSIKLKSDKTPGEDFLVLSQSKQGNQYVIQAMDPNEYLLRNIICIYYINGQENVAYSDEQGKITIDETLIGRILLVQELFPDVPSVIKDESNSNNHFEVTLSPTLSQVSFKGIDLTLNGKDLTCLLNFVLPFENIRFIKR
ncbi:MAG: hypothetical protein M3R25_12740 [Bacteroidota bacterium]|nr:hypothetical protein [Bacteroidota bacterium]